MLVDVGGVTYELLVPPVVLADVVEDDACAFETVHFLQTEGSRATPILIGFLTRAQRGFWEALSAVLGPRSAVKCFTAPAEHIARWIEMGDVTALKGLPGLGPAKARELIAKLQGKLARYAAESAPAATGRRGARMTFATLAGPAAQAIEGLIGLDYTRSEASELVSRALQAHPDLDTPDAILGAVFSRGRPR